MEKLAGGRDTSESCC